MANDDSFGKRFGQVLDRPFPAQVTKSGRRCDRAFTGAADSVAVRAARFCKGLSRIQVGRGAAPRENPDRGGSGRRNRADDKGYQDYFHG